MLLGGCATAVFDPRACPQEKKYSKAEQDAFLAGLPSAAPALKSMIVDYGKLRDQARACRGEAVPK